MSADGVLYLSAKTGEDIGLLKAYLKDKMGLHSSTEGRFMARRRHLDSLQRTRNAFITALNHAQTDQSELLAEELRQAQNWVKSRVN